MLISNSGYYMQSRSLLFEKRVKVKPHNGVARFGFDEEAVETKNI